LDKIFFIIARRLHVISKKIGLTYNEVNIIVYYFFVPFTWLALVDEIFNIHYLKILGIGCCLGFWIGCKDFKTYADWLFGKSVDFLNYFAKYGFNYVKSSVWICVVLPFTIYALLISLIIL